MTSLPDHVPPRRSTRKRSRQDADVPEPSITATGPDPVVVRRIRIASVLLALFSVLILVALASYSTHDEANAQLSIRDVFGVIRGDDELRVRFETTQNLLGLLGAVISHWMFTATIGVWSACIPILTLFWSYDLFRHFRITPLVQRRSIATLVATTIVSMLFGTMQLVTWIPDIPSFMSGAVGQFLAGILSQFIGIVGSLAVCFVSLGFVIVFGFDVPFSTVTNTAKSLQQFILAATRNQQRSAHATTNEATPAASESSTVADTSSEEQADDRSPKHLSPTVTILRSGQHKEQSAEDKSDVQKPAVRGARLDLAETQRRRMEEQTSRDVLNPLTVKGPTDPGDVPELPLFLDDSDEDSVTSEQPDIASPLVVRVESSVQPEPEVLLSHVTLYDEEISYKPPPLSLLVEGSDEISVNDDELKSNAKILQDKLETFRIKIENLTVQPGPVVTQYEFVPASGIKVSQIDALADDIALALKAPAVRIQAPVPGKGTVGIEIPNLKPSLVRFSSIIRSPKYHNPDIKLPIALGKTAIGEVYCADLTKMPHLLIAGATGKGKSVGINTLIASLIFRMHPRDLKFVIIDPKRVEMSLYRELRNHFLAVSPDIDETIITEPANAVVVLKNVVEEMQIRYNVLANAGQRNIADYNRKVKEGKIKDKDGFQHRPMPYIVVIIDELADLMMTAGKDVEEPIVRLAQLARAVGIHCVVATQRPSVDVVTGLIKANFPARIAYQVSARVDSRTILDTSGAEHLIGNGDMLFSPGNTPKPLRMQNAFISTEEVEAVCEHIGKQKGYRTPYVLPSILQKKNGGVADAGDRDALFEDAARIFIHLQQASVSTLQRRLKIGYSRAARIVDELESAGIVGPPDGSKGRAVLLQSESELEAYL